MVSRYFKKFLFALVLILAAGQNASAQFAFCNPLDPTCKDPDSGKNLDQLITGIMNFLFGLALVVCPALMVWGGFLIATAAGDENKVKSGRQIITYSIIGLVVIALSNVIKAVILDIANS